MGPKVALAIAAHPDDIEFLMSGTLIRLAKAGFEIHYWNLANGCCGSQTTGPIETAAIRRKEALASCQILNATFHEPICQDLSIFYDQDTLAQVSSVIRDVQPRIVLTHSLSDYMEDHMNTARLAVTGTFARAMKNFPVSPPRAETEQDVCLYHAQPYSNLTPMRKIVVPDLFIDTTDLIARKQALLACHASQKEWLDASQGIDSYLDALKSLDQSVGELSGQFEFAEGWRQHLHMGLAGESDNFLLSELTDEGPDAQQFVYFED